MAKIDPKKAPHAPAGTAPGGAAVAPPPLSPVAAQARPVLRPQEGIEAYEDLPDPGPSADNIGAQHPKVEPSTWWYIMVRHDRWMVKNGALIPNVKRLKATPGANGVDWNERTKKPIMTMALASMAELGWFKIPHDVDGPGTSYLRREKTRPGAWIDRWTTLYPGSPRVKFDTEAYKDWMLGLIARGVIAPCSTNVLEEMLADRQKSVRRYTAKGAEKYPEALAHIQGEIDVIEAELAARQAAEQGLEPIDAIEDVPE